MATRIFFFVNPFTAPACQISRLKSMHIHSCEQYTWLSYNKSTFNTVHFACLRDGGGGVGGVFKFGTFTGHFPSDGAAASLAVKG